MAESSAPIVGASEAGSRRAVAAMLFALVPLAALIHYGPDVGYWFPALVIALASLCRKSAGRSWRGQRGRG